MDALDQKGSVLPALQASVGRSAGSPRQHALLQNIESRAGALIERVAARGSPLSISEAEAIITWAKSVQQRTRAGAGELVQGELRTHTVRVADFLERLPSVRVVTRNALDIILAKDAGLGVAYELAASLGAAAVALGNADFHACEKLSHAFVSAEKGLLAALAAPASTASGIVTYIGPFFLGLADSFRELGSNWRSHRVRYVPGRASLHWGHPAQSRGALDAVRRAVESEFGRASADGRAALDTLARFDRAPIDLSPTTIAVSFLNGQLALLGAPVDEFDHDVDFTAPAVSSDVSHEIVDSALAVASDDVASATFDPAIVAHCCRIAALAQTPSTPVDPRLVNALLRAIDTPSLVDASLFSAIERLVNMDPALVHVFRYPVQKYLMTVSLPRVARPTNLPESLASAARAFVACFPSANDPHEDAFLALSSFIASPPDDRPAAAAESSPDTRSAQRSVSMRRSSSAGSAFRASWAEAGAPAPSAALSSAYVAATSPSPETRSLAVVKLAALANGSSGPAGVAATPPSISSRRASMSNGAAAVHANGSASNGKPYADSYPDTGNGAAIGLAYLVAYSSSPQDTRSAAQALARPLAMASGPRIDDSLEALSFAASCTTQALPFVEEILSVFAAVGCTKSHNTPGILLRLLNILESLAGRAWTSPSDPLPAAHLTRPFWYLVLLHNLPRSSAIARISPSLVYDALSPEFFTAKIMHSSILSQSLGVSHDRIRQQIGKEFPDIARVLPQNPHLATFTAAALALELARVDSLHIAPTAHYIATQAFDEDSDEAASSNALAVAKSMRAPLEAVVSAALRRFTRTLSLRVSRHSLPQHAYTSVARWILAAAGSPKPQPRNNLLVSLDRLLSEFPSLICNADFINTCLDVYAILSDAVDDQARDRYNPHAQYSRGNVTLELPLDFDSRKHAFDDVSHWVKTWLSRAVSRAPQVTKLLVARDLTSSQRHLVLDVVDTHVFTAPVTPDVDPVQKAWRPFLALRKGAPLPPPHAGLFFDGTPAGDNPLLTSHIIAAWIHSIHEHTGLFSPEFNNQNPLAHTIEYSSSNLDEVQKNTDHIRTLLAPHTHALEFLTSHFQATRYSDPLLPDLLRHLAHESCLARKSWCRHPLARPLSIALLAFIFALINASVLDSSVDAILRHEAYSALLLMYAGPPQYPYGSDVRIVDELIRNLKTLSQVIQRPDRSSRGPSSAHFQNVAALADLLVKDDIARLSLWLDPLNTKSASTLFPADNDIVRLAPVAWEMSPTLAVFLPHRFKNDALPGAITRLIRAFPLQAAETSAALKHTFDVYETLPVPKKIASSNAAPGHPSALMRPLNDTPRAKRNAALLFWAPLDAIEALELLWPKTASDALTLQYAMRSLETYPIGVTFFYVPQVVQALRHDPLGYAQLFLYETSRVSQLFSHQLIWNMKANTFKDDLAEEPDPMKPQLDHMVDLIVNNLSGEAQAFYEREFKFFDQVTSISRTLQPFVKKSKPEKKQKIDEEMAKIPLDVGVYLPSNPDGVLIDIGRKSGRPLQSHAKAPFMASFRVKRDTEDVWQSAIFKVGDDCRQDVLAIQVIALHKAIFASLGLDLHLAPYRVTATGPGMGVIDVVPNATSRDEMGRAKVNDLKAFFLNKFGPPSSIAFQRARLNFIHSQAAYSLQSYLIQIKDRHNGNIMIDANGFIVHIDFGFLFDIGPGGVKFEPNSFKLTHEMVSLIGGKHSYNYQLFCELVVKAFLASRPFVDQIVSTCHLMMEADFPSYKGEDTLARLRQRFRPDLSDAQAAAFMKKVIDDAFENTRSIVYDEFQYLQNGIPYRR